MFQGEANRKKRKGYKPKVPKRSPKAPTEKGGEERWTEMFSRSLSNAIEKDERRRKRATSGEVSKSGTVKRIKYGPATVEKEERRKSTNEGPSVRDVAPLRTDVVPGNDTFTAGKKLLYCTFKN